MDRPSTDIIIAAFNARYAHTSFGARTLLANMGALQSSTRLIEFDLQVRARTAVERMLDAAPRIVAVGCYIWNIELVTRVAALLKRVRPDIKLILGGPEISHETEEQDIFQYADHVVCGEGEVEFPALCRTLLNGAAPAAGPPRIIRAEPVDMASVERPYDQYTDEDIAHRVIYVEASRGCPFRCEFCMSSLDPCVRYIPEEKLFSDFRKLLGRGARTFKFVDRTFNIDIPFACRVLAFFKARYEPGMMLHFEMIPDRLPDKLMDSIRDWPAGALQFEVGIQTFNEEVARRIQRPLDTAKIEAHLRRLRQETRVHIHSDLIAGLPGEDMAGFAAGFDRLLALEPQEIQVGILKRLRGALIDRHTRKWNMVYSPYAPYEILSTGLIPFSEMQRIQRFARYWNLIVNNGQFIETAPLIWQRRPPASSGQQTPFAAFMEFSDWLYDRTGTTGNLHMVRLVKLLLEYLVKQGGLDEERAAEALWLDYRRGNRTDVPGFLKKYG
jgi:hypothetical protein